MVWNPFWRRIFFRQWFKGQTKSQHFFQKMNKQIRLYHLMTCFCLFFWKKVKTPKRQSYKGKWSPFSPFSPGQSRFLKAWRIQQVEGEIKKLCLAMLSSSKVQLSSNLRLGDTLLNIISEDIWIVFQRIVSIDFFRGYLDSFPKNIFDRFFEESAKLFYLSELYVPLILFSISFWFLRKVEFSNRNDSTLIVQGLTFKMHI